MKRVTMNNPTATVSSISPVAMMLNILAMLLLSVASVFAQGTVMPAPKFVGLDNAGLIVAGGKLCTYASGTTTPQPTYSDVGLTTPNSNPVILDSAGRATVYLSATSYKFILKTPGTDSTCSTGTTLWTQDAVPAIPSSSANIDVLGTAGEALSAGQAVYLSDGSGSKSAGQWYRADSTNGYSSVTPVVGMVPTAISSGSSGTVRLAGSVSGLSSLTTGTIYYISTTGTLSATAPGNARKLGQADTSTSLVLKDIPPIATVPQTIVQGRLSLTSGTPVTTADVTAATTVYWTCGGSTSCQISLYDGANWNIRTFTELSIAVPSTTNVVYDVMIQDNGSSAPTLVLAQWTNDVTRSVALATQNGVLLWTGVLTRRYVGTFRTTGITGQTEDSFAKRYLWNFYNRAMRPMYRQDPTGNWNYTTATYRQANANTANQLDFVIGVSEETVHVIYVSAFSNTGSGVPVQNGIGFDSTNSLNTTQDFGGQTYSPAAITIAQVTSTYQGIPTIGRHFLVMLEYSTASGTTTWYGTLSAISGFIRG